MHGYCCSRPYRLCLTMNGYWLSCYCNVYSFETRKIDPNGLVDLSLMYVMKNAVWMNWMTSWADQIADVVVVVIGRSTKQAEVMKALKRSRNIAEEVVEVVVEVAGAAVEAEVVVDVFDVHYDDRYRRQLN